MADVLVDPECNNPKELFGQGVRAFILHDFEAASAALSKASELLVQEHKDDMHDKLGEVYLFYGKSLLGLSREQNEALGDAVPKGSNDDSEDGGEEEEEEEKEETMESGESEKNKTEENSTSSSLDEDVSKSEGDKETVGDSKKETNGVKEADPTKPGSSSGECGEPGPSSSKAADGETTEEQNEDEEPSDLQVAWEVLELAKKIFERRKDMNNFADTLVVLGEVALENENFESAINDIKQALSIQKEIYFDDSRTLAETLYKLGIAYSTNSQFDEAIDHFNQSLEYLRNRIKMLEGKEPQTETHKSEIEELNQIIPDIEDKIADMRVYKEEAIKRVKEAIKEPTNSTQDGAGSSKEATNISHLVKRKRKLEEMEDKTNEEVPAKKAAA